MKNIIYFMIYNLLYLSFRCDYVFQTIDYDTIEDKVVIITGANSGIGFETARELAKRGGKIYMACRNLTRAFKARDDILSEFPNATLIVRHIDLNSFDSVRSFCSNFTSDEKRLDVLINNAAVAETKKSVTDDGLEVMLQTNHLGHFLLTNILLGRMRVFGGRIVIVSSIVHNMVTNVNLADLNSEKSFEPMQAYARTKLFNILFMRELNRRFFLGDMYDRITVNSLHPGHVNTSIYRYGIGLLPYNDLVFKGFFTNLMTSREGAECSVYLSTSKRLTNTSGYHWDQNKRKTQTSLLGQNMELAKKIWLMSQSWVKLRAEEYNLDSN